MISTLNLQVSNPALNLESSHKFAACRHRTPRLPLPHRRFVSLCLRKPDSVSFTPSGPTTSNLTASIGSPPPSVQLSQWTLSNRHFLVLNYIACARDKCDDFFVAKETISYSFCKSCTTGSGGTLGDSSETPPLDLVTIGAGTQLVMEDTQAEVGTALTAVSATLLFCAAIPTLLAFKRAAESVEKLLDVTREELPGTMASIRLSGMELSDLTMELSDLGQGITQGIKSSTRVVHAAKESLHRITNRAPSASMQEVVPVEQEMETGPMIARKARGMREGIVKSRAMLQLFFTLSRFTRMAFGYISSRSKS